MEIYVSTATQSIFLRELVRDPVYQPVPGASVTENELRERCHTPEARVKEFLLSALRNLRISAFLVTRIEKNSTVLQSYFC